MNTKLQAKTKPTLPYAVVWAFLQRNHSNRTTIWEEPLLFYSPTASHHAKPAAEGELCQWTSGNQQAQTNSELSKPVFHSQRLWTARSADRLADILYCVHLWLETVRRGTSRCYIKDGLFTNEKNFPKGWFFYWQLFGKALYKWVTERSTNVMCCRFLPNNWISEVLIKSHFLRLKLT